MQTQSQKFYYKLIGAQSAVESLLSSIGEVAGVIRAELDGDVLTLILDEWASEYDIFSRLNELGEKLSVEVDDFTQESEQQEDLSEVEPEEVEDLADENEEVPEISQKQDNSSPVEEDAPIKKKYLLQFVELGISFILLLVLSIFNISENTASFLYLIAFTVVGYELIWDAITDLAKKKFYSHYIIMLLVIVACLFLTSYEEATAVALIFQLVNVACKISVDYSDRKLKTKYYFNNVALTHDDDTVYAKDVEVGQSYTFNAGEVIPFDCKVTDGSGITDASAYFKKNSTKSVAEGEVIYGGYLLKEGNVTVKVLRKPCDSLCGRTYSKFFNSTKTESDERFDKFKKLVGPVSLIISLVITFIFPLFFLPVAPYAVNLPKFAYLAVILLSVTACLSLAIAYSVCWRSAVNRALLMGSVLNSYSKFFDVAGCEYAVFNEPGALTEKEYKISKIISVSEYKGQMLKTLERFSLKPLDLLKSGVITENDGDTLFACGSYKALTDKGITVKKANLSGIVRYVAINGEVIGAVSFVEAIKQNAYGALKELSDTGIRSMVVIHGPIDALNEIADVAEVYDNLSDEGKRNVIAELKNEDKGSIYVGTPGYGSSATAQFVFDDVENLPDSECGAIVPQGDVKTVAKLVKLAKRFVKSIKLQTAICCIAKLVAIVVGVALYLSLSVNTIWIAVLIDGVASLGLLLSALSNSREVY